MYSVVYLRNHVGAYATVFRTDTLKTKVAKYCRAGWEVFVSTMTFDSYVEAKALAATL